jgi:hypothetical protein
MGLGLSRAFMGRKLSVKYNFDYRTQNFDPDKNYRYTALNNKLQVGYRINRDSRVALTYQEVNNRTDFFGQAPSPGRNSRLQLDGAYRFKISGKKIINNFMVSRQSMEIPMLQAGEYKSTNLLLTHTSSVMLNKNILALTVTANQGDNRDYYFNTSMLNAEATYTSTLASNLRLGSSAGYYTNAGWNKQVGVKQQVSAVLFEKLSVDIELSYRKAVQITRPELANQVYFTSMIHYTF